MSRDMNEQELCRGGVWGPPASRSLQRLPPTKEETTNGQQRGGQSRGETATDSAPGQGHGQVRSAARPNSRKKPARPRAVSSLSLPSPSY